jgi:hypothetical protein
MPIATLSGIALTLRHWIFKQLILKTNALNKILNDNNIIELCIGLNGKCSPPASDAHRDFASIFCNCGLVVTRGFF